MNEKTISKVDFYFSMFFAIFFTATVCLLSILIYMNFDTLKKDFIFVVEQAHTALLSANGKVKAFFDGDPDNDDVAHLCGASEDERVIYSIRSNDTSILSEREMQMYRIVKAFVDKHAGKSDFEIAKAVVDYICENTTYAWYLIDHNQAYDDSQTSYGCLVLKTTAVCSAYANATKLLLESCGVEAFYVSGVVPGEDGGPHAWNLVKIQGQWYQLDTTWCDEDKGGWNYAYFLKSDDFFAQSRTWESYIYPKCPSSFAFESN